MQCDTRDDSSCLTSWYEGTVFRAPGRVDQAGWETVSHVKSLSHTGVFFLVKTSDLRVSAARRSDSGDYVILSDIFK